MEGERLWAVLSDEETNQNDLAIVVAIRERGRLKVTTEPSLGKKSGVDMQHLWTFPVERDTTLQAKKPIRVLVRQSVEQLRDALTGRLTFNRKSIIGSGVESLGKVVFVRLEKPTSRIDSDGDFPAIRRTLWERARVSWPGIEPDLLPCVVIANRFQQENGGGFELVTVTPAVEAPAFQEAFPENPTIALPDGSATLSVLTQCLLTVSTNEGDTRLHLANGPLRSWVVSPDEFSHIARDVAAWLGIEVP